MLAIRLLAMWAALLFIIIVCVSCARVVYEPMETVHRPVLTEAPKSVQPQPAPEKPGSTPGS